MEIYERYGPALLRKAERMLLNREDAEDVVQGLFIDLWQQGRTRVDLPYLFRSVTNRCLNLMRDASNRKRLLARQEPLLRGPTRIACDDRVVGLDLLLRLSTVLDRKTSEVLVYRYFDDMTQEEIAAITGASRKTIQKRLKTISSRVNELMANGASG